MTELEKICRIICKAENVDPEAGCGKLMPTGETYPLWKTSANALIAEGFADV